VPGKSEHEEGSCRKKPASRNRGETVNRETARRKQIALGGKRAEQAKSKSPSASERHSVNKKAGSSAKKRSGTLNARGPRTASRTKTRRSAESAPKT
jgi:hypothetical protein